MTEFCFPIELKGPTVSLDFFFLNKGEILAVKYSPSIRFKKFSFSSSLEVPQGGEQSPFRE